MNVKIQFLNKASSSFAPSPFSCPARIFFFFLFYLKSFHISDIRLI